MRLLTGLRRLIRGTEPAIVDYESYEQAPTGTDGPNPVLCRVGPASIPEAPGTYKIQQSYDSLVQTVRDLREALDGQTPPAGRIALAALHAAARRRSPAADEQDAERHAQDDQRPAGHACGSAAQDHGRRSTRWGFPRRNWGRDLDAIREQIETGNEIDRQLVESFNRFSMMIDRLHVANNHAVECLQQVRDSYAAYGDADAGMDREEPASEHVADRAGRS